MVRIQAIQATRARTFWAVRKCVQIPATHGHALLCWKVRWWRWMKGRQWALGSYYSISVHSNCHWWNAVGLVAYRIRPSILNPHHHQGPLSSQHWHQENAHPQNVVWITCHLPSTPRFGIHLQYEEALLCTLCVQMAFPMIYCSREYPDINALFILEWTDNEF